MNDRCLDDFLDGRLRIEQPRVGYRAGADAVMLGAACPATPGDSVLELGCGVGVAILCLARRVPNLRLTGIERQADYACVARANAAVNGLQMPASLREMSFDHVIANPPYFSVGTQASEPTRATARHEDTPLELWIDAALRRLRPGGRLVVIHQAARLGDLLTLLDGRAGTIVVQPISARQGRDAGRILIGACKGARGPLRLRAPLIMHAADSHLQDGEDLSPRASAILRAGAQINLW